MPRPRKSSQPSTPTNTGAEQTKLASPIPSPSLPAADTNILPSPIPVSATATSQSAGGPDSPAGVPSMPRASQFPCPRCGQPMKQNGKTRFDLYFYCRGFGTVPACGYPGKRFTIQERNELEKEQALGRKKWVFKEEENRYEYVNGEDANDIPN